MLITANRHRRSIRVKSFDYASPGAYFVTICAHERLCLFGDLVNEKIRLSLAGQIVQRTWLRLPEFFEKASLDIFTIMPNHFHGLIWILESENQQKHDLQNNSEQISGLPQTSENDIWYGSQSGSLNAIIQNFKSITTRKIHQLKTWDGDPVWQRNYWERIIRNERELRTVREYIENNPAKWAFDQENMMAGA